MSEEKQASKIEKTESGITWTDKEGKTHLYKPPIRTLYLQLQGLSRVLHMSRYLESEPVDTPLTDRLVGKAILEDRSLNVIGIPETSSNVVKVSFTVLADEDMQRINAGFEPVALSYLDKDWEIGNDSEWSCQIYLPASQFNVLNEIYNLEKISKIQVGLDMKEIYIDHTYAVPSDKCVSWFIEPTRLGSQIARGKVCVLRIETSSIDLRPPAPIENDLDADNPPVYKTNPLESIAPAIHTLAHNMNGTQTYLKWIFWALIGLIIVVICKY